MDHAERSIAAFLDGIASAGVTPAGGSAAACLAVLEAAPTVVESTYAEAMAAAEDGG